MNSFSNKNRAMLSPREGGGGGNLSGKVLLSAPHRENIFADLENA